MSVWGNMLDRGSGDTVRKEDDIKSSIVIEDKHHLLSDEEMRLLHKNLIQEFSLSNYSCLEEILAEHKPPIHIIIDPREPENKNLKRLPPELEKAKDYWEEKVRKNPNDIFARRMLEEVLVEIEEWGSKLIRGLYNSLEKVIMLFPNNMKKEYGGTRMKELLVSTLVHEAMHAYFDRVPLNVFSYIYSLEEPMAEFGMLLFLDETSQTDYFEWAKKDVGSKRSCYRYGVALMDQCEREGRPSRTRRDLELYKVIWPTFLLEEKRKGIPRYSVYDKDGILIEDAKAMNAISLIVVRDYCKKHKGVTYSILDGIFNGVAGYNLPPQYKGIIIPEVDVDAYKTILKAKGKPLDTRVHDDPITLASGEVVFVTNQWADSGLKANLGDFISIAKKLGYRIVELKPL